MLVNAVRGDEGHGKTEDQFGVESEFLPLETNAGEGRRLIGNAMEGGEIEGDGVAVRAAFG